MQIKINWNFSKITRCIFYENGNSLIGGTKKGSFFIYKMFEKKISFCNSYKFCIKYMLIEAGSLYAIFSDGKCRMINLEKFKCLNTFQSYQNNDIQDIDCYEKIMVTTDNKGMIKLWDTRIKTYFESIYYNFFGVKITKFLHKSFTLIASNRLSEIFIWDIRKIQKPGKMLCNKNKQNILINAISISKNRKFFFLCDIKNNFFQCYMNSQSIKYRAFEKISTFQTNVKKQLSSDEKNNFIGYGDYRGNIFIWCQTTGKLIYNSAETYGKISCFSFHPIDKLFCICRNEGDVLIKKFL
nr:U5 small nuclear ribonucleoprotein 40kDa subunit [Cryptomonas paramecium]